MSNNAPIVVSTIRSLLRKTLPFEIQELKRNAPMSSQLCQLSNALFDRQALRQLRKLLKGSLKISRL